MRVLFATTRGAGHFAPLVPFARACERLGHEVLVCGPPDVAGDVAAAGLTHWPVDPPAAEDLDPVWARVPGLSPDEQNAVVVGEIFGRLNTAAALPRMREAVAEWRPDLVLHELSEYASVLAAELAGVPHARVAIGLATFEAQALAFAAPRLDELRAELGLAPDPEARVLRESPFLTTVPASLEDPSDGGQPGTLRVRDPAWTYAEPSADEPPLVYLTLGSVAGSFERTQQLFMALAGAVADLPVRGLLTVGRAADVDAIAAAAPPNVRVEAWVPQAEALAQASAIVCHGGSGSTFGALAAAVPLVVVPLFADQPANAARVEAVGAGLAVPPDPAAIRGALERVLSEERFAAAARRLADEMRSQQPIDDAVGSVGAR